MERGRYRSEQWHLSPKLKRSANKHEHAYRDDSEYRGASGKPHEDRFFWKQLIGHCTPHGFKKPYEKINPWDRCSGCSCCELREENSA
jgi:hypothetical protein